MKIHRGLHKIEITTNFFFELEVWGSNPTTRPAKSNQKLLTGHLSFKFAKEAVGLLWRSRSLKLGLRCNKLSSVYTVFNWVPINHIGMRTQNYIYINCQRWSRGYKARGQGQGHKKHPRPRPRTVFPRTDTLEAKDRNARGQGQGLKTQAQVLSKKKKKKRLHKNFSGDLHKKNVFEKIFQALHKILTIQKIVLSSSRGQASFWGLEASRPWPRTWPSRPRPRTSKCVLEDVLKAKDVLEDSTSVNCLLKVNWNLENIQYIAVLNNVR